MQRSFGPIRSSQSSTPSSDGDFIKRETELSKREGILEERERQIGERQKLLDEKLDSLEKVRKDLVSKLEKVSSMSKDEAQKTLLDNVDKELAAEISRKIKEAEEEIKITADEKAKEILADAMQHVVTDYISEFTTSKIKLPDEEM